MPPKANQCRKIKKPSTSAAGADAMANCVFPDDVMVCILTRLPVKSIHRFKSVCKPWLNLFAAPRFVKIHNAQFSDNPENQSVVIYSFSVVPQIETMSLLKMESGERKPVTLDHPSLPIFSGMELVGSCNGLICMGSPFTRQGIVLFNPAMKLFKFVRPSTIELGFPLGASLGFGCDDDEGLDFKVVRIVSLKKKGNPKVGVVYSSNSDSWTTIDVGFEFDELSPRNNAIVNGNPYWIGRSDMSKILVWFDVKKMVFRVVPLSSFGLNPEVEFQVLLVNWKGSLGAIVSNKNGENRVESVDVWVLDDESWSKKHTFGIIDLNVYRFLQCSKSGKILGEYWNKKLFVFDPATGQFEEIVVDGAWKGSLMTYGYEESLAFLKGMEKVVAKNEQGVLEDDVGGGSGGC